MKDLKVEVVVRCGARHKIGDHFFIFSPPSSARMSFKMIG